MTKQYANAVHDGLELGIGIAIGVFFGLEAIVFWTAETIIKKVATNTLGK